MVLCDYLARFSPSSGRIAQFIDGDAVLGRNRSWLGSCGGCARRVTRLVRGGRGVGVRVTRWVRGGGGSGRTKKQRWAGRGVLMKGRCLNGSKNTKKADGGEGWCWGRCSSLSSFVQGRNPGLIESGERSGEGIGIRSESDKRRGRLGRHWAPASRRGRHRRQPHQNRTSSTRHWPRHWHRHWHSRRWVRKRGGLHSLLGSITLVRTYTSTPLCTVVDSAWLAAQMGSCLCGGARSNDGPVPWDLHPCLVYGNARSYICTRLGCSSSGCTGIQRLYPQTVSCVLQHEPCRHDLCPDIS
jgi:hypothetical protein